MMEDQENIPQQKDQERTHVIFPAYEETKRNILAFWLEIQQEYEKYMLISMRGSDYQTHRISSKLLTLYATMLREKFKKHPKLKTKIVSYDSFLVEKEIPEKDIHSCVQDFGRWMEESGITKIDREQRSWEDQFANEFPG